MGENFADLWEQITDAFPDAPAQVHGDRKFTWSEFDRRADGVAKTLLELGMNRQDKVAQYLYKGPEYLESLYGTVKASLVPVNTNYRYEAAELAYLWDNSDAVAVVFHGTFIPRIEEVRASVPGVRLWLWVDDGSGPCPDWAVPMRMPRHLLRSVCVRSGDVPATTSTCSTPAARPACPRASCGRWGC